MQGQTFQLSNNMIQRQTKKLLEKDCYSQVYELNSKDLQAYSYLSVLQHREE